MDTVIFVRYAVTTYFFRFMMIKNVMNMTRATIARTASRTTNQYRWIQPSCCKTDKYSHTTINYETM